MKCRTLDLVRDPIDDRSVTTGKTHAAMARKRVTILDLTAHLDKEVRVRFSGGREVIGILKGK